MAVAGFFLALWVDHLIPATQFKHLMGPAVADERDKETPPADAAATPTKPAPKAPPVEEGTAPLMDVAKGLKYCGGIAEVYWAAVELFCKLHREKQEKMEKALANGNWKEYTTLLHALKSTSLSLGGQKLSDLAKAQELAGKSILSPEATEEEKAAAIERLKESHAGTMELYDAFAAEASKKLEERKSSKGADT